MEKIKALVDKFWEKKIYLSVVDDRIKIQYDGDKIDNDVFDEIRQNKDAIVAYLKRYEMESSFQHIEAVPKADSYALSSGQYRLWLMSQLSEVNAVYNLPLQLPLKGTYDVVSLKKAMDALIEKHEILRTVFKVNKDGEPRQWILSSDELHIEIDYRDLRDNDHSTNVIDQLIKVDSIKPFDLEHGPLLRVGLFQRTDSEFIFYINMHHIISDGVSMDIMAEDLFTCYESILKGKDFDLTPLRIQYKDYAAWQLKQLVSEPFQDHKKYWLKQFTGELPVLNLPATKNRPKLKTNNGHCLNTFLSKETTRNLKTISKELSGSLFISLHATWNVLFYKYTGNKSTILGSPVAGRDHDDLKDQLGFYVNTIALKNEMDPTESFNSFYKKVKENTIAAIGHQMYPFDQLVNDLNLPRDNSRNHLFDVMLTLNNFNNTYQEAEPGMEEIHQIKDGGKGFSKFDIDLTFKEIGEYIRFSLNYNTDVYESEMIQSLMRHYKTLVDELLRNPQKSIDEIDFMSEADKQLLLVDLQQTKIDYPNDKTIVDLFEEQVFKTPDQTAIVFEDRKLSYSELNEISNQLAHYLKEVYSIQANDLVGIKLDRSEWTIAAILGILKAGGGYVPIDPEYPLERIDFISKDIACKVCMDDHELTVFKENKEAYSTDNPGSNLSPDNLVYVIYTSGTTGNPKGVMITHLSLVDYVFGLRSIVNLDACNTFGLISTMSADLGYTMLFPSLVFGGELHIFNREEMCTPSLASQKTIDCLKIVPSHWKALQSTTSSFIPAKCLIFGGEKLQNDVIESIIAGGFSGAVYNHYGPTETTIGKLMKKVDLQNYTCEASIPVGKAIGNSKVLVLNQANQLVPDGAVGEICIAGIGVSNGYLNNPELSKEKFIENPYDNTERLYKTGDLGKRLPNGDILFIDRKDNQVKINGYRIELGEVEQALQSINGIKSAVVVVKTGSDGNNELISYFTSDKDFNSGYLREELTKKIPVYMLPTDYFLLEEMPLTANGKIDKRALLTSTYERISFGIGYIAPRNELETTMSQLWSEILNKETIGIHDDFFSLGGQSIKVIKLVNLIENTFDVKLKIKDVFEHSTIERICVLVKSQQWMQESLVIDENNQEDIEI